MPAPGTARNGSVLLVEPDLDTRVMYTDYLQHRGLEVTAVTTAGHALAAAKTARIIITELLLPGPVDGVGLIERVKGDPGLRGIPLIAVTACVWPHERVRAEQAGCDLFLPKPCLPDDLAREVKRLLASALSSP